jgi:hypothetical protein
MEAKKVPPTFMGHPPLRALAAPWLTLRLLVDCKVGYQCIHVREMVTIHIVILRCGNSGGGNVARTAYADKQIMGGVVKQQVPQAALSKFQQQISQPAVGSFYIAHIA